MRMRGLALEATNDAKAVIAYDVLVRACSMCKFVGIKNILVTGHGRILR